jgi:uncharacterized protein YdeI (YjbR/CyaY-like superfamily)
MKAPKTLASGVVHTITEEMSEALASNEDLVGKWNSLTPLARNEFICWVSSAKREETRLKRINQMCENLLEGKRRPCCWPGCAHRKKGKGKNSYEE